MERQRFDRARLRVLPLVAVLLAAAGCGGSGSGSESGRPTLDATCKRVQSGLARVGPIESLGDATTALRRVLRLERGALADVEAAGAGHRRLADRFRVAIGTTQRSLEAIVASDPQQTMTPVRTGIPNAKRAAGDASVLVRSLCGSARD